MKTKKSRPQKNGLNKSQKYNTTMAQSVEAALKLITANRSKRCLICLYHRPHATTGEIAQACQVGNVSDAFMRVREELAKVGLVVSCYLPNPRIVNRFSEQSMVHRWIISTLPQGGE